MRARALVHVAGPAGVGKTPFVEALIADLGDRGAFVLAARCVRDKRLRAPRETAPKAHPELRRYLEAGATGAALFTFSEEDEAADAFFMTRLMEDYSEAVVLEAGANDLEELIAQAFAPRFGPSPGLFDVGRGGGAE